jgi:hypothetical protein
MTSGIDRSFPFRGWLVWLTPEQGGRRSGPPEPRDDWPYYAANAYVPPEAADTGLASFVVRGFASGAWRSAAEACWLVPDNPNGSGVGPGTVIVVTEGPTPVAFFVVEHVAAPE